MAWTVACMCGTEWQGLPPATCPTCGRPISEGIRPVTVDALLHQHSCDEIGLTTTQDGQW